MRRGVDIAMIFASLLVLAWPVLIEPLDRQNAGLWAWALGIAVVVAIGAAVAKATERWPLAQYAPVSAALVMAAVHTWLGDSGPQLIWLILIVTGVILIRQFLGSHTNQGLMRDLTRQRAILARQAFRDPLTGLGNRAMFMDHAKDALDDADNTSTAVILFDLDGFKGINDTYGHAAGDELLKITADRLNANVRANDTVSRLGGDEFVVLLPRLADDEIADTVASRILRDLQQPVAVDDLVLSARASAGISIARGAEHDVDSLLREADEALYHAKDDGKGVVRRFDPARFAEVAQRRRDESDLRRALAECQFEVHYQPIVDLDGEHTVGVEALVRWRHPIRGLLAPGDFIDLTESLGLMDNLGLWVLREACVQAVQWQRAHPGFKLNVNLSATQLASPELTEEIRTVLTDTGMPADLLVLELTESAALTDLTESARVLDSLKSLGVRIALDDFGTGFSSLSHLGALPVDVVKIDKSFVQAMQETTANGSVAEAVLHIARTFNLSPVAEGVEDEAQAAMLRDLACTQAQGYHFAKPMPAAELTGLLNQQAAVVLQRR
ncbi:putative bifunctional diguanylate cyclase/phosphodiesterase [Paractinoplanes abujensis]|uniref:Diguanylate cyclase (GGDEF)-like protein n=1 Tax=Paractinoplanes abujensis TaxID=882441 RepID=A0A7W7G5M5_9ACTN|nr:EAL domain-containing protein [Actinoplanes abujensis]MBB4695051.1 diguanylate cyclase (GGDEF)-like protein [Actinoplanes abujensis]